MPCLSTGHSPLGRPPRPAGPDRRRARRCHAAARRHRRLRRPAQPGRHRRRRAAGPPAADPQRLPRDEPAPSLPRRRGPGQRPGPHGDFFGVPAVLDPMTHRPHRDQLLAARDGEPAPRRSRGISSTRSATATAGCERSCTSMRADALDQARAVDAKRQSRAAARPLRRRAGRRSRTCSASAASRPPAAARCSRTSGRPTTPTSSRGCRRPTRCCSARRTWTSSRWARPPRTAPTHRRATRGTWSASPAARRGGSAAAVAAGEAPAGARHRHRRLDPPAGRLCGVVGLKPTYGRVCRYGLVAFASSLDQVGPFAHDVADARPAARSHRRPRPARQHQRRPAGAGLHARPSNEPVKPLTIGVPREYFGGRARRRGRAAVRDGARRSTRGSARRSRRCRCRTARTPSRPTTSWPRPRRRATWPATTACTTAIGRRSSTA